MRPMDEVGARVDSLVPRSTAERAKLVDAIDGNVAVDEIGPHTKLGIMCTQNGRVVILVCCRGGAMAFDHGECDRRFYSIG